MMNLLSKYNQIIEKYGYDVLLVRQDKQRHCSCFDEKTQSASRACPFCYGVGYVTKIEKHKVRDLDTGLPMSLPLLPTGSNFGVMSITSRAYFFKREVEIQENDLIIDVSWNGDIPVYTGNGIYQISHIDPQRFEEGELIFQKVYVKDTPINKKIRGFKIVEDAGKIFYEMAEEKGVSE